MIQPDNEILVQLIALADRLYRETDGFADNPGDAQLWYNRGYANGMLRALTEIGKSAEIAAQLSPDPANVIAGQEVMPWGKAYLHGAETGYRETFEIMPATE